MNQKTTRSFSDNRFSILLTATYLIAVVFGIAHHELWRDEMEGWMIAREAHNFSQLFQNMRYQGHPALWHIFLFLFSRVSRDATIMQGFHALLAIFNVFLFARYAPFPRLHKALFAFGYYALFEYAIISRNYAIGLSLLFLICIVRDKHFWQLAILLGLLANTNVYMTIVSIALCYDFFIYPLFYNPRGKGLLSKIIIPLLLVIVFYIAAVIQLRPPSDSYWLHSYNTSLNFADIRDQLAKFFSSFFVIPNPEINFWNTTLIENSYIKSFLAVLLLIIILKYVIKNKRYRILFTATTITIMAFSQIISHYDAARHIGIYFILFIALCWISGTTKQVEYPKNGRYIIILVILVCQLAAGIFTFGVDILHPFSDGKSASAYLQKEHLENENLIGVPDYTASTIAGYLDRPIYYPERGRSTTFMVWDRSRLTNISSKKLEVEILRAMKSQPGKSAILITDYNLQDKDTFKFIRYSLLKDFERPIVYDEWFRLYMITQAPQETK